MPLPAFVPWNTLPGRRFFSGEAIYRRTFTLERRAGRRGTILLDFGAGTPTADTRPAGSAGIHALLEQPVRDAAAVYVNGRRAGSIWHPPYAVDVGNLIKPGLNRIEVHVFNTAVNALAGQPPRDYSELNATYGKRFDPQDMDQIRSLPSGLSARPALRYESGNK